MYTVKHIKAKNFMAYSVIDLDLTEKSLILIRASQDTLGEAYKSNGAGKSTIAEAICYTLYGRLLRGCKDIEHIIKEKEKDMFLEIILQNQQTGDMVTIQRIVEKKANENKKSLQFYVNGKLRDFDKKNDADNAIAEFLGISYDMLLTRFLTPENTSFLSLKPSERFVIIDSLMSFDWDKVNRHLTKKVNDIKTKMDVMQNELQGLNLKLSNLSGVLSVLDQIESSTKAKIVIIDEKLVGYTDNLNELKEKQTTLKAKGEDLQKEHNKIVQDDRKVYSKISSLARVKEIFTKENPDLEYKKKFDKLGEINCPHCNKSISFQDIASHLSSIRKSEILEAVTRLDKLIDEQRAIEKDVKIKLSNSENEMRNFKTESDLVNSQFSSKMTEVKMLMKEKESLETEIKKYEQQYGSRDDLNKQKDEMIHRQDELNSELSDKDQLYSAYLVMRACTNPSSKVRMMSVEHLLKKLEGGINTLFSSLLDRDIKINFVLGKKEVYIESDDIHIPTMSTGERRCFDISTVFTLQEMASQHCKNNLGIFIGDELFDALDGYRILKVVNLIQNLYIPQIFVVTHNEYAKIQIENLPLCVIEVSNIEGNANARIIT